MKPHPLPNSRANARTLIAGATVAIVSAALFLFLFLVPLPYIIHSPGPTINVLGDDDGTAILEVEGGNSDDDGQLRLVTVGERGGPGRGDVTAVDIIRAAMTPGYDVLRYSDVYGDEKVTAEQVKEASQAQMQSSQSTAPVAALDYLGFDIPTEIEVAGVIEGSPAEGQLQEGDILVAMTTPDGKKHSMDHPSAPFSLVETLPPGTTIEVEVTRGAETVSVPIQTYADPQNPDAEGSKLGIFLSVDSELPVDVNFHVEKIGGPSAGLIFALGVIDKLSDEPLTGGQSIAGTGTLSFNSKVGPIGGIVQKMYGAVRDGADWFLAPADNCEQVIGNVPDGIEVIAVATLDEAVAATEAIGDGDTDDLPRCEAVVN